MKERWIDITGYEGYYQVSDNGKIKSLSRKLGNNHILKECIKKTQIDKYGYEKVLLYKNGVFKNFSIHRLVAENFLEKTDSRKNVVNHKDENKLNNNFNNLEWCDEKYNYNYGTRIKRVADSNKNKIIVTYQDNTFEVWDSAIDFAREFGILQSNIIHCLKGRQKTYHGMKFEYFKKQERGN